LVILHFNDAYDIQKDPNGNLGFINFYDHLQKMRTLYPKSLLVFSGDAFAPSRLSRVHQGWQMVKCLKMLKIDIACYGNHDFDFHPDHALKLAKACEFPWLMGNIKYPETN
jgi:5'-nucleotidase